MTEIQDPGAPRTDELARNAALHALADVLDSNPYRDGDYKGAEKAAGAILYHHHVTWERGINSAGVAVRRIVMRGEWTVDPTRRAS